MSKIERCRGKGINLFGGFRCLELLVLLCSKAVRNVFHRHGLAGGAASHEGACRCVTGECDVNPRKEFLALCWLTPFHYEGRRRPKESGDEGKRSNDSHL